MAVNEIIRLPYPCVITSINSKLFFQGSFPGINNLNACGNTVQENRHRLAVPKHERLQAPIDARVIERLRQ